LSCATIVEEVTNPGQAASASPTMTRRRRQTTGRRMMSGKTAVAQRTRTVAHRAVAAGSVGKRRRKNERAMGIPGLNCAHSAPRATAE
jgi:hypothetical protein